MHWGKRRDRSTRRERSVTSGQASGQSAEDTENRRRAQIDESLDTALHLAERAADAYLLILWEEGEQTLSYL